MGVIFLALCEATWGQDGRVAKTSDPPGESVFVPWLHSNLMAKWHAEFESTFGTYDLEEHRGHIYGPLIADQLHLDLAADSMSSNGYITDAYSGANVDYRNRKVWAGALTWTPSPEWEMRLMLAEDSRRDGDDALTSLGLLESDPFTRYDYRSYYFGAERHFIDRDAETCALELVHHAAFFDFVSLTEIRSKKTHQRFDPHRGWIVVVGPPYYSVFHDNYEESTTWNQAFLLKNSEGNPVHIAHSLTLQWEAGFSRAESSASTDSITHGGYYPDYTSPEVPFLQNRVLDVDEDRLASWARVTLTAGDKLDVVAGLAWDRRERRGQFGLNYTPITPSSLAPLDFSEVSVTENLTPEATIAYRVAPGLTTYFRFTETNRPFGYNPTTPFTYGSEESQTYTVGVHNDLDHSRLHYHMALFYTDIQDFQVNVPVYTNYLDNSVATVNAGAAHLKGVDIDFNYQILPRLTGFGWARWQDTAFDANAFAEGISLSGLRMPYVPDYRAFLGLFAEVAVAPGTTLYALGGMQWIGSFFYDVRNRAGQNDYALANCRAGLRQQQWFIELFIDNAFNTLYAPYAQPESLTYSRLIEPINYDFEAEVGAPRTAGIRVGIRF